MSFQEIAQTSDEFTDEMITDEQALRYGNEAIAIINSEVGINLPFAEKVNETYTALNGSWLLRLLSKYMSWGIKMNDGSVNEADRFLEQFYTALDSFRDKAVDLVDEEYVDEDFWGSMVVKLPKHPFSLRGTGLGGF